MPSLLGIEGLERTDIQRILDRAREFQANDGEIADTRRGKVVANLIFDAAPVITASFEMAARRLGAEVFADAPAPEPLMQAVKTVAGMAPDAIVLRHSASGAALYATRLTAIPIVNAGDGAHEHPIQALTDALAILRVHERLDGLKVVIAGAMLYSGRARSDIHVFSKLGAHVELCGPRPYLPAAIAEIAPHIAIERDRNRAVEGTDAVIMLEDEHSDGMVAVAMAALERALA